MEKFDINRKIYEIVLDDRGNFISLDEVKGRIGIKTLTIGGKDYDDGYRLDLYYIYTEGSDTECRLVPKERLLFSYEIR